MPLRNENCIYECNKDKKCTCTDCDYCTLKPYQHQENPNEDFFECQNEYLEGSWYC